MIYYYKLKSFSFETVPNNTTITLLSYLSDSTGLPLMSSTGLDTFSVITEKSSLPVSPSNYESFFQQLITSFVYSKYSKSLVGNTYSGSNIIDLTSTAGLLVGMNVSGSDIPSGSILSSIRDSTSARISNNCTVDSTSATIKVDPLSWTLNFDALTYLLSVVDFSQL